MPMHKILQVQCSHNVNLKVRGGSGGGSAHCFDLHSCDLQRLTECTDCPTTASRTVMGPHRTSKNLISHSTFISITGTTVRQQGGCLRWQFLGEDRRKQQIFKPIKQILELIFFLMCIFFRWGSSLYLYKSAHYK